jgi:TolA-binding protein
MKILQAAVLLVIFSSFAGAYAADSPIVGGATPIQSFQTAGSPPTVAAPKNPEKTPNSSAKAPNTAAVGELESQMTQLNQAALQYQQQTNQKMEALSSKVDEAQAKIEKLTQAILMLNQQQSALSQKAASAVHKAKPVHDDGSILSYFAFGLVAMLAIIMGVILSRQKKIKSQ